MDITKNIQNLLMFMAIIKNYNHNFAVICTSLNSPNCVHFVYKYIQNRKIEKNINCIQNRIVLVIEKVGNPK